MGRRSCESCCPGSNAVFKSAIRKDFFQQMTLSQWHNNCNWQTSRAEGCSGFSVVDYVDWIFSHRSKSQTWEWKNIGLSTRICPSKSWVWNICRFFDFCRAWVELKLKFIDLVWWSQVFDVYVVGEETAPGVVVVQEWWGVDFEIKNHAMTIAQKGYRALIPEWVTYLLDLYSKEFQVVFRSWQRYCFDMYNRSIKLSIVPYAKISWSLARECDVVIRKL